MLLLLLGAAVLLHVALEGAVEPAFELLGVPGLYQDAAPLLEAHHQPGTEGELEHLDFRDVLEEHVAYPGLRRLLSADRGTACIDPASSAS